MPRIVSDSAYGTCVMGNFLRPSAIKGRNTRKLFRIKGTTKGGIQNCKLAFARAEGEFYPN